MAGLAMAFSSGRPAPALAVLGWRTVDRVQLLDDRIGHRRARVDLQRVPDGDRSRRTTTARGVDDGEGGRSLRFTGSSGVRYDCPFASAPIGATGGCVLGCGGGFCRSLPPPLEEVLTLRRAGPSRRSRIVCRTRLNAGTSAAHRRSRERGARPIGPRDPGAFRSSLRSCTPGHPELSRHGDADRGRRHRAQSVRALAAQRRESRQVADSARGWTHARCWG